MPVTLRDSFANVLYDDFKSDLAGHWTDRLGSDEILKAVCERAGELAERHYKPVHMGSLLEYKNDVANLKVRDQQNRIFELENKLARANEQLRAREKEQTETKESASDQ